MTLIDPVLLKAHLGVMSGRFDVDALALCDSTSSELMRRAERGAPAGSVIVADEQSAGRGRRGRQWLSAPAASLTFSLLWRFSGPATMLSGLSLAVGVGLTRGLESLGAQGVCLKWPNDVLVLRGHEYAKLAGILVELSSDRKGTQAVIGIGVNLQAPVGNLPQPAVGLNETLLALPDRHVLLAAILLALADVFETFAVDGFLGLKNDWQARHAWQDQPVQLLADEAMPLLGRCLGVDNDGALLLETENGIQRILSGDVSLRPAGSALGVQRL